MPTGTGTDRLDEETRSPVALLAHFGYGGGAGALYALVDRRIDVAPIAKGLGLGLLVWLVSYMALLPGAGFSNRRRATRRDATR